MDYFLKILFVFAIFYGNFVFSLRDKCHTDEVMCIKECCNSTDFSRVNPEKCHLTWKYFNISFESKLNVFNGNHRYMNLLVKFWNDVSVPCLKSEDLRLSWQDAFKPVEVSIQWWSAAENLGDTKPFGYSEKFFHWDPDSGI